jgi:predicted pyridoxine 5'-phosphate oxidase superfamily flavin-nucleotide-binding protein
VSYPNCQKYIQRRRLTSVALHKSNVASLLGKGDILDDDQQAFIREADTFFVASAHPEHGVDVSHRGGRPGFVTVLDEVTLRIPDYVGNTMFNTLGNFSSNPHAGLIFLDFEGSRTLQLLGRPEILMDQDYGESESGGTRRFWALHVEHWREMNLAETLKWQFVDYSPSNPRASETEQSDDDVT